jgi:hypothetical protein
MKPWSQFEFWCEVLAVVGGIGWIWQLKRKLRRENQKDMPDPAAVKQLRSEECCAWILATIVFLSLLRVLATLR